MEAFSDGVLAILVPHEAAPAALLLVLPVFLCHVLSFIYLAIYR